MDTIDIDFINRLEKIQYQYKYLFKCINDIYSHNEQADMAYGQELIFDRLEIEFKSIIKELQVIIKK